jgi:hypothetical protein
MDIKLPVNFIPHNFQVDKGYKELQLTPDLINQEFHLWLKDLNLKVCPIGCRFFIRYPRMEGTIHVDAYDYDASKLLFIYDSKGTTMNWYELLPGKSPTSHVNYLGEVIRSFDVSSCKKITTTAFDNHCLLNGRIIHRVDLGHNNFKHRKCYSITLLNYQTGKRINWDEAIEIFKPYFVNG